LIPIILSLFVTLATFEFTFYDINHHVSCKTIVHGESMASDRLLFPPCLSKHSFLHHALCLTLALVVDAGKPLATLLARVAAAPTGFLAAPGANLHSRFFVHSASVPILVAAVVGILGEA